MKESCENCFYAREHIVELGDEDLRTIECRRHALGAFPTHIGTSFPWPCINPEVVKDPWCGEWKPMRKED